MTYFIFILKAAFFDFSRNKGRTLLTSLGILIGVLAVVLLIAFGLGLKKYISDQFESLGSNNLRVVPGNILQNGSFRASGGGAIGNIRFDEKDVLRLKRIRDIKLIAPVITKSIKVVAPGHSEYGDMYGSTADIFGALNLTPQFGRLFTKNDNENRSKVAVIGPKIAEKLFSSGQAAVGRRVKVDGQTYRIIGVLESKGGGGLGGPDLDSFVYVPYKTAFLFIEDKKFLTMIIIAQPNASLDVLKGEIKEVLLKRYKEDDFSVIEQTEILNAVSSIFNIMNSVLVAIAAISLVVGGIGIMNIMYVTVTERIKEIGIRRALGARKYDILYQFIIESVLLSLFGGALGILLAFLIVLLIQRFFPAYINIQSVALALGVSSLIGIVFGVLPAKKAADLSPMEAIRYE
jgi:putative ABC transport system permease protein